MEAVEELPAGVLPAADQLDALWQRMEEKLDAQDKAQAWRHEAVIQRQENIL